MTVQGLERQESISGSGTAESPRPTVYTANEILSEQTLSRPNRVPTVPHPPRPFYTFYTFYTAKK